jgi:hypothetical protein
VVTLINCYFFFNFTFQLYNNFLQFLTKILIIKKLQKKLFDENLLKYPISLIHNTCKFFSIKKHIRNLLKTFKPISNIKIKSSLNSYVVISKFNIKILIYLFFTIKL